jgi:uncharacterized protein YecT (DUF1311 family)
MEEKSSNRTRTLIEILAATLVSGWLAAAPALADQAAWVEKAAAERAAERIRAQSVIRSYCAPCGDRQWTEKPVRRVEVRNPSGAYYQVAADGEELDLAYVYLPEGDRWRNVAIMLGLDVSDVPEFLSGGEPIAEYSPDTEGPLHPLDRELDACMGVDPSTAGMVNCMNLFYEKWDAELNRVHGALRATLDPAERETLRTAQLAWIAFRDAEFELMARMYGRSGGSLARIQMAGHRVDIVRRRTLELAAYAETVP